jgi:hypothetical protein
VLKTYATSMENSVEALWVDSVRVRTLYAELLLSYPREQVSIFLNELSHQETDPAALAESIWKQQGQIPLALEQAFYQHLDTWLSAQAIDSADFADRAFRRFAEQPALSARHELQAYLPHMPLFYSTHDQRQLLLKLLSPMNDHRANADLRLVYQSIRYGWRRDLVLFHPSAAAHNAYRTCDFGRWMLRELAYAPLVLGLPAFEETRLWTDLRDPAHILAAAGYTAEPPVGRTVSLYAYLAESGFSFSLSELPDSYGTVFAHDVRHPASGRVLLKAGCLYGVPCALSEFRYQTALGKIVNPFERLVGHLVESEYTLWKQIQERHELLLEELRLALEVVYHRGDDSISVNSHHLMRNVPAKILRNVLREYAQSGRSEFENREFKRDAEICMDPINPNFEGRLNRVIEHLHRVPGFMEIEKVRRGSFRFTAHRPLRYHEED